MVDRCAQCQAINVGRTKMGREKRERGKEPGIYWEIDFTEMKPGKYGHKYMWVFVDTFSGWVEAFSAKHETAGVVAKKLLEEIIPRFGLPLVIGSENGAAFVSSVSQALAKAVGTNWKLHCAFRPQSSRQVERMNQTLKVTLTKLILETGGGRVDLLPLALLRARCIPYLNKVTPFEIMFGRPPPTLSSSTRGCPRRNDWSVCTPVTAGITFCLKKSPRRDPDCPHWDRDGGGTTSLTTRGPGLDTSLSSGKHGALLEGTVYCYPDHPHHSKSRRH